MSLEAMDWVWTLSKSKGVGRLVMLALADKALPAAGECKSYGSYRFLAQRANCTQGAITEALDVLYALGELELLPTKGPMGAATYRLPKAIGHVRAVRSNRSAHPSDSTQKNGKESLGSAEQQVHGSPERSEAESLGSADHYTTTSPKTTTSAPAAPPASPATEGGGGGQRQDEQPDRPGQPIDSAETFLQSLPGPWAAGRKTARELAPLLLERIAEQGWQLDDALSKHLSANPGGVQRFPSVLKSRIDDLPKKPSSRTRDSPTVSDWCGHCNRGEKPNFAAERLIDLPNGTQAKCHCHPGYQPAAA